MEDAESEHKGDRARRLRRTRVQRHRGNATEEQREHRRQADTQRGRVVHQQETYAWCSQRVADAAQRHVQETPEQR